MVTDSSKCKFINDKGEITFTTHLPERGRHFVGDFHEGRVWIKKENRTKVWECYNTKGELAFKKMCIYQYDNFQNRGSDFFIPLNPLPMDFSNGVASVSIIDPNTRSEIAAIIDTMGNIITKKGLFYEIGPFGDFGLAVYKEKKGGLKGLVNAKGEKLTQAIYKKIEKFQNGYAKVSNTRNLWGLIGENGNEVLSVEYVQIDLASEGKVATKKANKYWVFKDLVKGKSLPGTFRATKPFKDGIAMVTKGGKEILINERGERIFFHYGTPSFFSEGIFGIENFNNQKPFYTDASGNNIFGKHFEKIFKFNLGVAKVQPPNKEQLFGAINTRGVMIVPPKYKRLHPQPDGNIIINPQRFFGLVDKKGNVILEPKYDKIDMFKGENLFRVERGESLGYLRSKNGKVTWIWELQN